MSRFRRLLNQQNVAPAPVPQKPNKRSGKSRFSALLEKKEPVPKMKHPDTEKELPQAQPQENIIDLMDETAHKAGWLVLSPGAAYEKTLHRYDFYKKMKNEDGKPYDQHSIGGTLMYLFKEPDESWIGWRATYRETSTPKNEVQFAKGSFYEVFREAQKHERQYKQWLAQSNHQAQAEISEQQKPKPKEQSTPKPEPQGIQTSLPIARF